MLRDDEATTKPWSESFATEHFLLTDQEKVWLFLHHTATRPGNGMDQPACDETFQIAAYAAVPTLCQRLEEMALTLHELTGVMHEFEIKSKWLDKALRLLEGRGT